jgi:preprotein translocase subunit SecB
MTDAPAPDNGAEAAQPGLRVLAQFIRDLSFENPNAPDSLRAASTQPQMDVGVEMNARGRPDGLYEVDLKISANAQRDAAAVFQIIGELSVQGGFPPFLLDPLDFAGIYFAQKQQQQGLSQAEPAGEA